MKPLTDLDPDEARALRGLLFDLDDTLLSHGRLTLSAYESLWALHDGGLQLVAVTGRPSGWGDVLARQWPIAGCVAENGAIAVLSAGSGVVRRDACDPERRRERQARLARLVERVNGSVPEARLTDDIGARVSDVTWDIGERERPPAATIARIVSLIDEAGARWTQSSVHLHATFDTDDKASGALRFCARELGQEPALARQRFAFIGDSGNDAACFAAFRTTFGVANVLSSVSRLSVPPLYIAPSAMGDGFAQVARAILELRQGRVPR